MPVTVTSFANNHNWNKNQQDIEGGGDDVHLIETTAVKVQFDC